MAGIKQENGKETMYKALGYLLFKNKNIHKIL